MDHFLPSFKELRIPLLSTATDAPLFRSSDRSLVETVVEAILSEPISLRTIASALSVAFPDRDSLVKMRLLSFTASSRDALTAEEEGVHERVIIDEPNGRSLLCSSP
jgi:hypothetical protein